MKKIHIILFYIVSFQTLSLQGQELKTVDYSIYYDFSFIKDTSDMNSYSKSKEFLLYKIENISRFLSNAQHYNDSTHAEFAKKHPQPEFKSSEEAQAYVDLYMKNRDVKGMISKFQLDKDFKQKNFVLTSSLFFPYFLQEEMNFNWLMTPDVDTLYGFPCTKATTNYGGRTYHAWFTMSIPINDGPYFFSGLPGLIVKIEDDQKLYRYELISMNLKPHKRFVKERDHSQKQSIDRKAFVDKHRKYKENPKVIGILDMPEERLLALKERYKIRFDLLMESY